MDGNEVTKPSKWKFPQSLAVVGEFVISLALGTIGFLIIAGGALAVSVFATYVDDKKLVPPFFVLVLRKLEYGIFVVDVIVFVLFAIAEAMKTGKKALADICKVCTTPLKSD